MNALSQVETLVVNDPDVIELYSFRSEHLVTLVELMSYFEVRGRHTSVAQLPGRIHPTEMATEGFTQLDENDCHITYGRGNTAVIYSKRNNQTTYYPKLFNIAKGELVDTMA